MDGQKGLGDNVSGQRVVYGADGWVVHVDLLDANVPGDRGLDDGENWEGLADTFLDKYRNPLGLDDMLAAPLGLDDASPVKLRPVAGKKIPRTPVRSYQQLLNAVPIWGAGLNVQLLHTPRKGYRVVGLSSNIHRSGPFDPANPQPVKLAHDDADPHDRIPTDEQLRPQVAALLGLDQPGEKRKLGKLVGTPSLYYYRYDQAARTPDTDADARAPERRLARRALAEQPDLQDGLHYLAYEVRYRVEIESSTGKPLEVEQQMFLTAAHFDLLALIPGAVECEFGAPASATTSIAAAALGSPTTPAQGPRSIMTDPTTGIPTWALVVDPLTVKGVVGTLEALPALDIAALPAMAQPVMIENAGAKPAFLGEASGIMELDNYEAPDFGRPALQADGKFDFSKAAGGFPPMAYLSATTTYYHVEFIFRMLRQFGLLDAFTDGSTPLSIDYLYSDRFNAQTLTYSDDDHGRVLNKILFGPLRREPNMPHFILSLGLDVRFVLHEFCHLLIWWASGSLNLPFAHSAGDSLAAILTDPDSQLALDRTTFAETNPRFATYPWFMAEHHNLNRNFRYHGRVVTATDTRWSWSGQPATDEAALSEPGLTYIREQILSTSLFKAYCKIGGNDDCLAVRWNAASYMAYLIIQAILHIADVSVQQEDVVQSFVTMLCTANEDVVAAPPPNSNSMFGTIPSLDVSTKIRAAFTEQGLVFPVI